MIKKQVNAIQNERSAPNEDADLFSLQRPFSSMTQKYFLTAFSSAIHRLSVSTSLFIDQPVRPVCIMQS